MATTPWSKFITVLKHPKSKKLKPKRKQQQQQQQKRPVVSKAECLVCLETEPCVSTSTCNHPICVNCLGTYISVTHNSRMPCPCPSSAICKAEFTIDDIAPFVDDEQICKIWLGEAAKKIEAGLGMYCPRKECSKPILWKVKSAKKRNLSGKCRSCGQHVCTHCKSAFHTHLRYGTNILV